MFACICFIVRLWATVCGPFFVSSISKLMSDNALPSNFDCASKLGSSIDAKIASICCFTSLKRSSIADSAFVVRFNSLVFCQSSFNAAKRLSTDSFTRKYFSASNNALSSSNTLKLVLYSSNSWQSCCLLSYKLS